MSGLRGPLTDPLSVRGQAEGGVVAPVQERPAPPASLKPKERKFFELLVDQAVEAGTPMERIDAITYGNIARLQLKIEQEKDANVQARLMRTLLAWMTAAGMNAVGRARLGVKRTKQKTSKTAQLLALTKRPQ